LVLYAFFRHFCSCFSQYIDFHCVRICSYPFHFRVSSPDPLLLLVFMFLFPLGVFCILSVFLFLFVFSVTLTFSVYHLHLLSRFGSPLYAWVFIFLLVRFPGCCLCLLFLFSSFLLFAFRFINSWFPLVLTSAVVGFGWYLLSVRLIYSL